MGRPIVKIDIGCADRPATLRFYQELFGWGAEPGPYSVELDRGVASPPALSASITSLGHEPHQYVMFYVDVDDIPACLDRALDTGREAAPRADRPAPRRAVRVAARS
jgi:predicted enzyme related to lactoylglutathione lyase